MAAGFLVAHWQLQESRWFPADFAAMVQEEVFLVGGRKARPQAASRSRVCSASMMLQRQNAKECLDAEVQRLSEP